MMQPPTMILLLSCFSPSSSLPAFLLPSQYLFSSRYVSRYVLHWFPQEKDIFLWWCSILGDYLFNNLCDPAFTCVPEDIFWNIHEKKMSFSWGGVPCANIFSLVNHKHDEGGGRSASCLPCARVGSTWAACWTLISECLGWGEPFFLIFCLSFYHLFFLFLFLFLFLSSQYYFFPLLTNFSLSCHDPHLRGFGRSELFFSFCLSLPTSSLSFLS